MKRDFSRLAGQHFDVLICGGGIYGAWTAYDCALRGLKVAILDQGDWAGATSSASSKLIHGGLRYLETFDFTLVKKSLRERQMFLEAAPHRVWPLRFGVPAFADSRLNNLRIKIGLTLYDFFAGIITKQSAHRHFGRDEFAKRFPILKAASLTSGFTYCDAQTDDARFVLELVDGAASAGAVCVNYCKVSDFIEHQGLACGARVIDEVGGSVDEVHAKQVVNTIGQWANAIPQVHDRCRLSKGVHVIVPNVLGSEALLLTAKSDGRVFFMIPWYGRTLIGTTDTGFQGDVDHVTVEADDVRYLLNEANGYLESTRWTESDIIGRFAGLRVLKQGASESPSALSRDWQLDLTENGVLTSIGGKFTSARADAAQIADSVCQKLALDRPCKTDGHPFPWRPETDFQEWSDTAMAEASRLGADDESALWLIRRHGKRVSAILQAIEKNPRLAKRVTPALPFIDADLLFCAEHEMVVHLDDLLRRRLPLLILSKLNRKELLDLARAVSTTLGWNDEIISNEVAACADRWLQS